MKCLYCGKEVKDKEGYCKHCKSNLKASKTEGIIHTSSMQEINETKNKYLSTFIVGVVALCIAIVLMGLMLSRNIDYILTNEITDIGFVLFMMLFPYTMLMFLPFIVSILTAIVCFLFSWQSCVFGISVASKILLYTSLLVLVSAIFFSMFSTILV